MSSKCNWFSSRYGWKIAQLALNNNQSLTVVSVSLIFDYLCDLPELLCSLFGYPFDLLFILSFGYTLDLLFILPFCYSFALLYLLPFLMLCMFSFRLFF